MKAVVTGGAGFIGSALVDRLIVEGWQVDVIDDLSSGSLANLAEAREAGAGRFTFHRLDIRADKVTELIRKQAPDVVFHLAAQADVRVSVADPVFDAEVNVIGALRVCEGAVAGGATKIVFAGSGGTLYGTPDTLPVPESAPHRPEAPYGVAKMALGYYLETYRALRGIDTTVLALANVYGPRQDPHGEAGVVAIFCGKALRGETCTIFGDGQQTRDFVYVGDVADAFMRAARQRGVALGNVGTGVETSVLTLHKRISALTGSDDPPEFAPARAGELQRSALDPSYLADAIGWKPQTSLDEGLSRTLDYFRRRGGGAA